VDLGGLGGHPAGDLRGAGVSVDVVRRERRTPGEAGVWVFILGDMLAFAVIFAVLVWQQRQDPAGYAAGQEALQVGVGIANTIILLTSSLAVAAAVRVSRGADARRAVPLLAAAIASGVAFIALKAFEWTDLATNGHGMRSGTFETYYFAFTGLHLLHVVIGLAVLGGVLVIARRSRLTAHDHMMFESGTSYWHMVDLLWIVLFGLLYLLA
jgi:nitric oxide reductase NorE protein